MIRYAKRIWGVKFVWSCGAWNVTTAFPPNRITLLHCRYWTGKEVVMMRGEKRCGGDQGWAPYCGWPLSNNRGARKWVDLLNLTSVDRAALPHVKIDTSFIWLVMQKKHHLFKNAWQMGISALSDPWTAPGNDFMEILFYFLDPDGAQHHVRRLEGPWPA
jgi:hypothetical protein